LKTKFFSKALFSNNLKTNLIIEFFINLKFFKWLCHNL
jgi:hypothetical protein